MKKFNQLTETEKQIIIDKYKQKFLEEIVGWKASRLILEKAGIEPIVWKKQNGVFCVKEEQEALAIHIYRVCEELKENEKDKSMLHYMEELNRFQSEKEEMYAQTMITMVHDAERKKWEMDVVQYSVPSGALNDEAKAQREQAFVRFLEKNNLEENLSALKMDSLFNKGESYYEKMDQEMDEVLVDFNKKFHRLEEYLVAKITQAHNALTAADQSQLFQNIIYEHLMNTEELEFEDGELWHISKPFKLKTVYTRNSTLDKQ